MAKGGLVRKRDSSETLHEGMRITSLPCNNKLRMSLSDMKFRRGSPAASVFDCDPQLHSPENKRLNRKRTSEVVFGLTPEQLDSK
jgi:hypothetical protein